MSPLSKVTVKPREALRRAREATGLTQRQLADAAACTTATISDLESGRNHEPSHEKVVHIYRALCSHGMTNVTMDELFSVSDISVNRVISNRRKSQGGRWIRRT